jgi:hypothetical protein
MVRIAALCLALVTAWTDDELVKIEPDFARAIAEKIGEEAAKIEKPRVKVEPDAPKAVGLHVPEKMGLLVVPAKELKEGQSEDYAAETGKPLGTLFLYKMLPVAGDKEIARDRLHALTIKGDGGEEFPIQALHLSVRKVADDDWRLYAFGKEEKPVVDVKFASGSGPGDLPVAVESKEVDGRKGTLVLTLFNKYQASVPLARKAE